MTTPITVTMTPAIDRVQAERLVDIATREEADRPGWGDEQHASRRAKSRGEFADPAP